ncbi:glycosyltransferase family 4 protein [Rhodopirellula sp. P2]|uniref:glycosyltransferase family 4 protein n=1 Tax=Rhodopirellula sp. P2 TaxID=2127060 RepID=UPI002368A4EA|nr:glycosyltransferase family 4 protein [Rhodopirellula sp. P2]WDQ17481.1 glycosyltransferase family 4 protein [Rhodopirellula sp. P2]
MTTLRTQDEKGLPNPTTEPNGIKILHVCETAKGGIATYLRIMHHATSNEFEHHVVLPEHHRKELQDLERTTTFLSETRSLIRLFKFLSATWRASREQAPDIFFFHSSFALAALACSRFRLKRQPMIYCPHGWAALQFPDHSLKRKTVSFVEYRLSKLADVVINISGHEQGFCRQRYPKVNAVLVENAVESREAMILSSPIQKLENHLNILFVGRLDRQKGFDILLLAFKDARNARPDLHLHVVGESVLANPGSDGNTEETPGVTFYGWKSPTEVQSFINDSDIVVVPSRWEGFGLVVAEAYRSGTPVLVSDRCALPELVIPNRTGWVIPFDQRKWSESLARLKKSELAEMQHCCTSLYETRFHSSRFGRELDILFRQLLERK